MVEMSSDSIYNMGKVRESLQKSNKKYTEKSWSRIRLHLALILGEISDYKGILMCLVKKKN